LPFLALPGGVPPCPGGGGAVALGVVAVVVTVVVVVVVVLVLVLEVEEAVLVLVLGVELACEVELVAGCDELVAAAEGVEADEVDWLEPPVARA
jgi:hypothetical protein